MSVRVRKHSKPFKACRKCKALVDHDTSTCPHCGSSSFTEDWEGLVIIVDVERSKVAKFLDVSRPGRYAIKIR